MSELEEGTAEIGFLIPRELFEDEFDQFIKQLAVINRIIREFSEAATGSAQEIKVRQISSSDPLLFLGLDPITIGMIGATITWALDVWKRVSEIRGLRVTASKIPTFKEPDLKFFDDKIKTTVAAEIETKAKELQGLAKDKDARTSGERRTHITWVLKTLLALVERGLKVEIRSLPPSPPADDSEAPLPQAFKMLNETIPQLVWEAPYLNYHHQNPHQKQPQRRKQSLLALRKQKALRPRYESDYRRKRPDARICDRCWL